MEPTASNRIVQAPAVIRAVANALIVQETDLFCVGTTTEGGIHIPMIAGDKKYGIGEVVSRGPKCETVEEGDIVVFQLAAGAGMDPIPNGTAHPTRFEIIESSVGIVCRIPKDQVDAERARVAALPKTEAKTESPLIVAR